MARELDSLNVPFSRYRRVLYRVAYRVLENHQGAKDAVRNCLLAASCNAPRFKNEGAFRSWLVRALIDESLAILYNERIGRTMSPESILDLFIQDARGEDNKGIGDDPRS